MCEKLLTIAVPSYNAEKYLRKCLTSFLENDCLPYLDIIVVDDGSTDSTARIGEEFAERYPDTFRCLKKENGGHGSGINASFPLSRGKYFKVVDADDWVITENLPSLLAQLKDSKADVLLAPFHTVDMLSGEKRAYSIEGPEPGRLYSMDEIARWYPAAAGWFSFHSVFYRRDFYEKLHIELSEKIFYEDTEYSVLPSANAQTVEIAKFFFYQYMIGNADQSVSIKSYVKREKHLEQVMNRLLSFYKKYKSAGMPETALEFMRIRIMMLMGTYEKVLLIYHSDRKYGREQAKRLRKQAAAADLQLEERSRKRYYLLRLFHVFHINPVFLEKLYAKIKK